tara:strand:- start:1456 stop:1683 length:228 start_codon:yes stop_codon:yes gene_type:complete
MKENNMDLKRFDRIVTIILKIVTIIFLITWMFETYTYNKKVKEKILKSKKTFNKEPFDKEFQKMLDDVQNDDDEW